MLLLSKDAISELRQHGLLVGDEPGFDAQNAVHPHGYMVIKPSSVKGNCLPDYEAYYKWEDREYTDAPSPLIWHETGSWQVRVHEYIPGPGLGDFQKSFPTEKQAIQFIIRYFFGETKEFSDRLEDALRYQAHRQKLREQAKE